MSAPILSIARAILGARPVTRRPDEVSAPGKVALARTVLSLPALIEAWRAEAANGGEKAEAMRRCAADLERAIGAGK